MARKRKEMVAIIFLVVAIILLVTSLVVGMILDRVENSKKESVGEVSSKVEGVVSLVVEKPGVLDEG